MAMSFRPICVPSKASTATQQGAAPDRLQLRSSFLLTPLSAAGELGVRPVRAALILAQQSTVELRRTFK
jgi:hypothetical protein